MLKNWNPFSYIVFILGGICLGIYFFQLTHYEAAVAAVNDRHLAAALGLPIIIYCLTGTVTVTLVALAALRYAVKTGMNETYLSRLQYVLYPFLVLGISPVQLWFPGSIVFFKFLFIGICGFSSAYLLFHFNPEWGFVQRRSGLIMAAAAVLYMVFFGVLSVQKHRVFMTHAFDLGIFTQTLWGYSRGMNLVNSVLFEPVHLLGDHWSPISFLFVPVYRLWTNPMVLLIIQSIYLGLGAAPLYLLVKKRTRNNCLAAAFSVSYLLFSGLHGVNLSEFHYISMVVPLFFLLFLMNESGNRAGFYLVFALLLCVREDVSFHLFFYGLFCVIFTGRRLRGGAVMLISGLWFYLVLNIFIPFYNSGNPRFHMEIYSQLGNNVPEIAVTLFLHPLKTIRFLLEDGLKRAEYLGYLFLPTGFGNFCTSGGAFLVLPSILFNILSNFRGQYTIKGQYTSPVIPFLFLGAIYGFERLANTFGKHDEKLTNRFYGALSVYLVITGILSAYFFSPSPLSREIQVSGYRFTEHDKILHEILSLIPSGASVCAQSDLVPHLSHRKQIFVFPVHLKWADYVVLDLYSTCFPLSHSMYRNKVIEVFQLPYMGIFEYRDGILLFRRGYTRERNNAAFQIFHGLILRQRLPDGRSDLPKGSYVVPLQSNKAPILPEYDGQIRPQPIQ